MWCWDARCGGTGVQCEENGERRIRTLSIRDLKIPETDNLRFVQIRQCKKWKRDGHKVSWLTARSRTFYFPHEYSCREDYST